ncbi:MAG: M3 family metallopeptidase [Polyangiales bacterium]
MPNADSASVASAISSPSSHAPLTLLEDLARRGVDWPFASVDASTIEPAIRRLVARARKDQAAIGEEIHGDFAATFGAFDAMTEDLDLAISLVGHLESVASTPALRDAYNAIQAEVSAHYGGVVLDAALHRALKGFAESGEGRALDGERRRYVDKTLADFRRHGALLDDAGKRRLTELDVALAQKTLEFSQNVVDATGAIEFIFDSADRLAGLPEGAIAQARESAKSKGRDGYRLTLQAPTYLAVMTHADDRALRETMFRGHTTRATRAPYDNRPLVREILSLRREKARLLGYRDFADLILEDRMAGTGARARAFVAELRGHAAAAARRENDELLAFARATTGDATLQLEAWDVAYWAEQQRMGLYDFDPVALRPYFTLDAVLAGLFAIAERLYGLRISPWKEAETCDPQVRAFRVVDADDTPLGAFHVDVFPRENKRDGAWMHGAVTATDTRVLGVVGSAGARTLSLECLVGNLTPPIGDAPTRLSHAEVETMFHEFGHLLHHLLGARSVRALGGIQVAWDFVELPSMIMENWCWERQALDLFARHAETGEKLPDALFSAMKRARTFRAANAMFRQLGFAEADLALHCDLDPTVASADEIMSLARSIAADHASTSLPDDYAMIAGFAHLFGGPVVYAAGYYSYKWAEVLEADAFTRFRDDGVFSRSVGESFRASVLSRGDSDDAGALFRAFMGRDAKVEALLVRAGLRASAA